MFDPMFVPPRHHAGLFWFARTFVPKLGRHFGNVHDVTVAPEDLERLRALRGHRAILSPNHPTETDPIVVFWLSGLLDERFNFLSTRETLDGPRGWCLNRIGAYSVIRGYPDRESIRATRRLLAEEDRKVVIFPEGLVYEHNDRLLQFQSGVPQMGFWALDDLEKAGKTPRLPIAPLAIRYRCCGPPEPAIERGLAAVEAKLRVERKGTPYDRLLRLGSHVVALLEREEELKPDETLDLTARITRVREQVLKRVARSVGATLDERQTPGDQLHLLYNEVKEWIGATPEEPTAYEAQRYRQRAATGAALFNELARLNNTVAVTGDYIASEPTAERFLEVLGRLQKEVLGQVRHQTPLAAVVRAAPPIWLDERLAEYRQNKRQTVADVTRQLQETIRTMLQESAHLSTPLGPEVGVARRAQSG
jgi:1-acyl-sn-glycerol-3-phosphate acyltransferase